MARTYQPNTTLNSIMTFMMAVGVAPKAIQMLTVTGRRSGQSHSVPISPITLDDQLYLVSPYGEVAWVKNVRLNPRVDLGRKKRNRSYQATETAPNEAAPVLQAYLQREKIVRPYFDVSPHSSLEDIEAEAGNHPVFRLTPA